MRPFATFLTLLLVLARVVATQESSAPPSAEQMLMESALRGNLEVVQALVEAGVEVDVADGEKRTSLMWAAFNGHTAVVAFLLEKGAKLDSRDTNGRTALMYASSGPFADTVELLLKKGADPNVQGTLEGFTPLMTSAAEGQLEVVRLLLTHGADPTLEDEDGDTAKSFAEQNGHGAVVELLDNPAS